MKVKFTKLAALLLAGAALFATGCTDYEVDIQKVDKKVDELAAGRVASLENQVKALETTVATLESKADHDADIKKLENTISELEKALTEDLDAAKKRIAALEAADEAFKTQIAGIENTVAGHTQAIELINGEISGLKTRLDAAEAAIKKINEVTIPAIEEQIKDIKEVKIPAIEKEIADLKSGKLDVAVFNEYKQATAQTIALMQDALAELAALTAGEWGTNEDGTPTTIKQYIDKVATEFNGKYLTVVAKAFGTEEKMKEMEGTLLGRIEACEGLLAGEWGDATVKQYIDTIKKDLEKEISTLKTKLAEITNEAGTGRLDVAEENIAALETSMDKVIAQLQFAFDYEGGLQAYIDDAAQKAYDDACDYAYELVYSLYEWTYEYLADIYDWISIFEPRIYNALERIQSIQYVPDYDDLKITSNMAKLTVPDSDGEVIFLDEPTQVTYQFLPAQYAQDVADGIEDFVLGWEEWQEALEYYEYRTSDQTGPLTREELKEIGLSGILAFFDVKPVDTRTEEEIEGPKPAFRIVSVDEVDTTTGNITFTVLPVNVASAHFAATDLQPNFVYTTTHIGFNIGFLNVSLDFPNSVTGEDGETVENGDGAIRWPAFNWEDVQDYRARTAFAAQLRLYNWQDYDAYEDYDWDNCDWDRFYEDWDYWPEIITFFIDYENELASPYNVLFPAVTTEIEVLPEAYKKLEDGTIREFYSEEKQNIPEGAEDEVHLKLPYNSAETRIILDQAVAAYKIGDEILSFEEVCKKGYVVPEFKISDEAEIDYVDVNGTQAEKNYKVDANTYAKVNMALTEPASDRKGEIGNKVAGTYTFTSEVGEFSDWGDVTITKELGSIALNALIEWNWKDDADVDHNLFYSPETTPNIYSRKKLEINIDPDGLAKLAKDLGLDLSSFKKTNPKEGSVKVTYCTTPKPGESATQEELPEGNKFAITDIYIEGEKLSADIEGFEWDKTYRVTATYELDYADIKVTFILTTVDRNREPVNLPLYEYTFNINKLDAETGYGYIEKDPVEDSYYYWDSKEADKEKAIFVRIKEAFEAANVTKAADFKDQDAFNVGELEGKLAAANDEGTAWTYIDIRNAEDVNVYAWTLSTLKASVLKGDLFSSHKASETDPYVVEGNIVTRNITTYIGEKVQIPFKFNYRVPAYDFLHQGNYTFDDGKWYTMASPKYDTSKKSLAKYDVNYMNVPALAFNIIDEGKRIFNYLDEVEDTDATYFYDKNLFINFYYTDKAMDDTALEEQSATETLKKYGQLWSDATVPAEAVNFKKTVFYYRSVRDAIPMYGTLAVKSGDAEFEIPTSFEAGNGGKYIAAQDYSNFELRAWKPFYVPTYNTTLKIKLDEHGLYTAHVLEGLQFFDARQVAGSTPVDEVKDPFVEGTYSIEGFNYGVKAYFRPMLGFNTTEDGEKVWDFVVGNAKADGTSAIAGVAANGFADGVTSWEAYDLQTKSFEFDDRSGVPADLRRLIEIDNETYTMTFDYNSEIEFQEKAEVTFSFLFQTPWQKFDEKFNVTVEILGLKAQ